MITSMCKGESWMFQVEFYQKDNGDIPVEIFLKSLPPKLQSKHLREFELLMMFGLDLKEPHTKAIKSKEFKGLYELRIKFASDISRVFYFLSANKTFVLLHGFVKKSQKIPFQELKKALVYKKDYERRINHD